MRTLIIAEAGVNHNGSVKVAKQLIDVAAEAGVDFVKFQTYKTENLVSKTAKKADYQQKNSIDNDDSQFNMLKRLELSEAAHHELINYCKKKNIRFLSTGFDKESIDFLESLNLELYKIPSGEITNKLYLQHIASKNESVILSTGMSNMEEIKEAVRILLVGGLTLEQITVLHCNTEYPTPMEDVNLKAMLTIQKELGVKIGYSDHTLGIEVPIAAVALGARVIEKHFTLNRNMSGPDHKASLEPHELKAMVKAIRNIENAMGDGIKKTSVSEKKNIAIARKSIHLSINIKKGEVFKREHLELKRPGDGISAMEIDNIIGKIAKINLEADHKLEWEDLI